VKDLQPDRSELCHQCQPIATSSWFDSKTAHRQLTSTASYSYEAAAPCRRRVAGISPRF
jgi:hypothetical protein